jgi:hypothetical protein
MKQQSTAEEFLGSRGIFYLPPGSDFVALNEEESISKVTHSTIPMLYTEQGSLDELIEICKKQQNNETNNR